MHDAVREYVARYASADPISVIEIGCRDVNGIIRDLFPACRYLGLDIADGPGVDIVCDAADYQPPDPVDLVICCEVLEHAPQWQGILLAAVSWLKPGGRLIVTCAGPGRLPHSAIDGEALRPGEYYRNLATWELVEVLSAAGIRIESCEYQGQHCDCRLMGIRRAA